MKPAWYEPTDSARSERLDRGSRFIAEAFPLRDSPQAKEAISRTRLIHPGATHVVHAFSVGSPGSITEGYSDDGEPKGTAGRPVLDAIRGRNMTNVMVTVVRYYGGKKLGTGGLVRAYGETAADALDAAQRHLLIDRRRFTLETGYEYFDATRRVLEELEAQELDQEFQTTVRITGLIPEANGERMVRTVTDLTRGSATISLDKSKS